MAFNPLTLEAETAYRELEAATKAAIEAKRAYERAVTERNEAIRLALRATIPYKVISLITGLSRSALIKIGAYAE